jgi:hypothetical protein
MRTIGNYVRIINGKHQERFKVLVTQLRVADYVGFP